jgi:hypothetical protein
VPGIWPDFGHGILSERVDGLLSYTCLSPAAASAVDAAPASSTRDLAEPCYTAEPMISAAVALVRDALADLFLAYQWLLVFLLCLIAAILPPVILFTWLGI